VHETVDEAELKGPAALDGTAGGHDLQGRGPAGQIGPVRVLAEELSCQLIEPDSLGGLREGRLDRGLQAPHVAHRQGSQTVLNQGEHYASLPLHYNLACFALHEGEHTATPL